MTEILHQGSFGLMWFAALVAAVVSIERIIFSNANMRRAKLALRAIDHGGKGLEHILGKDPVSEMLRRLIADRDLQLEAAVRQDWAEAAYLHARDELSSRMWILDTVVTAAPLMGLLGTIFGIVDTFLALSHSGMSDPAAVSAGIGTALYATALGISIALVGLLSFNYLSDRNERIGEHLKMLILRIVSAPSAQAGLSTTDGVRPAVRGIAAVAH
jgi:biopolymer transport protein ExbB